MVKSTVEILQSFEAFSEYMNFTGGSWEKDIVSVQLERFLSLLILWRLLFYILFISSVSCVQLQFLPTFPLRNLFCHIESVNIATFQFQNGVIVCLFVSRVGFRHCLIDVSIFAEFPRMELSISDHCVYLASSRTSEQRLKLSRWMRNELVLSNEHTELHSLIILYCVIWCYYYILCFNYFHYKFTLSYPENNLPPLQILEQTSSLLSNLLIKTDYLSDYTYVVVW